MIFQQDNLHLTAVAVGSLRLSYVESLPPKAQACLPAQCVARSFGIRLDGSQPFALSLSSAVRSLTFLVRRSIVPLLIGTDGCGKHLYSGRGTNALNGASAGLFRATGTAGGSCN